MPTPDPFRVAAVVASFALGARGVGRQVLQQGRRRMVTAARETIRPVSSPPAQ
ncbi:MAG: hypothetical protein JNK78_13035 [Planctomycetes bacterium]|nr:hypothetical protein [Planctomycetota bacterium]